MKKERDLIVFGLLLSAFIVLIKIYAGEVFNSYLFMVSGYYTLIDMAILFLAFIGSVTRGRRASKKEPFGFGKFECYSGIAFGVLLNILSIFIIVKSFFLNYSKTQLQIILVIIFVIIFKYLDSKYKFKIGKEMQSEILIDASIDAYYDELIDKCSLILIVLSASNPLFDLIGSVVCGLLIFYKGFKIFFNNLILLYGKNTKPKTELNKIQKIIDQNEIFTYANSYITSVDKYKKLTIEILIEEDIIISTLQKNKMRVIREIKKNNQGIKMVEFEIYKK